MYPYHKPLLYVYSRAGDHSTTGSTALNTFSRLRFEVSTFELLWKPFSFLHVNVSVTSFLCICVCREVICQYWRCQHHCVPLHQMQLSTKTMSALCKRTNPACEGNELHSKTLHKASHSRLWSTQNKSQISILYEEQKHVYLVCWLIYCN